MTDFISKEEKFSKWAAWALLLLGVVFVFLEQKWLGGHVIIWDVRAYYAYLPATFIHQDWSLSFLEQHPHWIEQRYWPNQTSEGTYVIKMTMGMSILYLPYFLIAHLWAFLHSGMPMDGFSEPYQMMLALSAPIHLFLGLLALRKFLKEYFEDKIVALTLILMVLATNAAYYTYQEGAMSHIHNFMLYAFFLRLTQLWHQSPNWKNSIYLGLVSGLIALIRPNNVLIALLFIFYNINSLEGLRLKAKLYLKEWKKLLGLLLIAFLVLTPQLFYWKYVTGHWIYYSYQSGDFVERFFFDRPRFALGLFSYTKGWLVYTPLGYFCLLGTFLLYQKAKAWQWIVPIFLFLQIYFILSWWNWWYGGSFGQRAFIDFYPVLSIGLAAFLTWIWGKMTSRIIVSTALFALLFLNLFQTWQYSEQIIRWSGMSAQAYWSVFLKTKKPSYFDDLIKEPKRDAALRGEIDFWGPDSLRCF